MTPTTESRIAQLNDGFRTSFIGGKVVFSYQVAQLPEEERNAILTKVQTFNDFTEDNDPYGEHDFGAFEHLGQKLFWKIDYYDLSLRYGSDDPANPAITRRVLTVLFADEY